MANFNFNSFVKCFVPGCSSSSKSAPEKVFFAVPRNEHRQKWCVAVGRQKPISATSPHYCCQDHFDVENDVYNWDWCLTRMHAGCKVTFQIKENVLPRRNAPKRSLKKDSSEHESTGSKITSGLSSLQILERNPEDKVDSGLDNPDPTIIAEPSQTNIPPAETKRKLQFSKVYNISIAGNGNSGKRMKMEDNFISFSQVSGLSSESSAKEEVASEIEADYEEAHFRLEAQRINMRIMEKYPQMYLGLSTDTLPLIDLLEEHCKLSRVNVFLSLRKIRLDEPEEMLGHIFGVDKSTISRWINGHIPILSAYLRCFIYWPDRHVIQANLPLAFRANFPKVESIIDCFEVEIEKPSNPLHQTLTWSSYKNCNTIKFLVSCCPDGHINFISGGFGGRTSDLEITRNSGYLNILKPKTVVMADRGFKHVESLLLEKDCSLLRPPSVEKDSCMTAADARYTKVIASLRIHVERVIKRIRDYSFLEPHACFNHGLSSLVNCCVYIIAALSNTQNPIVV